ncbi:MAG TPA: hypothetical protein VNI01_08220 [Elusimicrobiota bacterium]|nr:hypothetical protein [Elusimicrobiota bacterium]
MTRKIICGVLSLILGAVPGTSAWAAGRARTSGSATTANGNTLIVAPQLGEGLGSPSVLTIGVPMDALTPEHAAVDAVVDAVANVRTAGPGQADVGLGATIMEIGAHTASNVPGDAHDAGFVATTHDPALGASAVIGQPHNAQMPRDAKMPGDPGLAPGKDQPAQLTAHEHAAHIEASLQQGLQSGGDGLIHTVSVSQFDHGNAQLPSGGDAGGVLEVAALSGVQRSQLARAPADGAPDAAAPGAIDPEAGGADILRADINRLFMGINEEISEETKQAWAELDAAGKKDVRDVTVTGIGPNSNAGQVVAEYMLPADVYGANPDGTSRILTAARGRSPVFSPSDKPLLTNDDSTMKFDGDANLNTGHQRVGTRELAGLKDGDIPDVGTIGTVGEIDRAFSTTDTALGVDAVKFELRPADAAEKGWPPDAKGKRTFRDNATGKLHEVYVRHVDFEAPGIVEVLMPFLKRIKDLVYGYFNRFKTDLDVGSQRRRAMQADQLTKLPPGVSQETLFKGRRVVIFGAGDSAFMFWVRLINNIAAKVVTIAKDVAAQKQNGERFLQANAEREKAEAAGHPLAHPVYIGHGIAEDGLEPITIKKAGGRVEVFDREGQPIPLNAAALAEAGSMVPDGQTTEAWKIAMVRFDTTAAGEVVKTPLPDPVFAHDFIVATGYLPHGLEKYSSPRWDVMSGWLPVLGKIVRLLLRLTSTEEGRTDPDFFSLRGGAGANGLKGIGMMADAAEMETGANGSPFSIEKNLRRSMAAMRKVMDWWLRRARPQPARPSAEPLPAGYTAVAVRPDARSEHLLLAQGPTPRALSTTKHPPHQNAVSIYALGRLLKLLRKLGAKPGTNVHNPRVTLTFTPITDATQLSQAGTVDLPGNALRLSLEGLEERDAEVVADILRGDPELLHYVLAMTPRYGTVRMGFGFLPDGRVNRASFQVLSPILELIPKVEEGLDAHELMDQLPKVPWHATRNRQAGEDEGVFQDKVADRERMRRDRIRDYFLRQPSYRGGEITVGERQEKPETGLEYYVISVDGVQRSVFSVVPRGQEGAYFTAIARSGRIQLERNRQNRGPLSNRVQEAFRVTSAGEQQLGILWEVSGGSSLADILDGKTTPAGNRTDAVLDALGKTLRTLLDFHQVGISASTAGHRELFDAYLEARIQSVETFRKAHAAALTEGENFILDELIASLRRSGDEQIASEHGDLTAGNVYVAENSDHARLVGLYRPGTYRQIAGQTVYHGHRLRDLARLIRSLREHGVDPSGAQFAMYARFIVRRDRSGRGLDTGPEAVAEDLDNIKLWDLLEDIESGRAGDAAAALTRAGIRRPG